MFDQCTRYNAINHRFIVKIVAFELFHVMVVSHYVGAPGEGSGRHKDSANLLQLVHQIGRVDSNFIVSIV
jgi:hypothetical protein